MMVMWIVLGVLIAGGMRKAPELTLTLLGIGVFVIFVQRGGVHAMPRSFALVGFLVIVAIGIRKAPKTSLAVASLVGLTLTLFGVNRLRSFERESVLARASALDSSNTFISASSSADQRGRNATDIINQGLAAHANTDWSKQDWPKHNYETNDVWRNALASTVLEDEGHTPPVAWKPEAAEALLPDLYQSEQAAAMDLSRHTIPMLLKARARDHDDHFNSDETSLIRIHSDIKRPVAPHILEILKTSLCQSFPSTEIVVGVCCDSSSREQEPNQYRVEVGLKTNEEFTIEVQSRHRSPLDTDVPFVHAPWVVSENISEGPYTRVRTTNFDSSRRDAESTLEDQVVNLLVTALKRSPSGEHLRRRVTKERVARALKSWDDRLVVDRFTQKLTMDSGDKVYRSTARINTALLPEFYASANKPSSAEIHHVTNVSDEHSSLRKAGAFLLSIVGVYLGLKIASDKMAVNAQPRAT